MELQNSTARRPERRRHKRETEDRFLPIRQWLNIIFMLGALVGVIVLFLNPITLRLVQLLFLFRWSLRWSKAYSVLFVK